MKGTGVERSFIFQKSNTRQNFVHKTLKDAANNLNCSIRILAEVASYGVHIVARVPRLSRDTHEYLHVVYQRYSLLILTIVHETKLNF